ncbi:MAG: hypothetical protein KC897_00895 [Candidatus Omnitrophica bacterium]|nr:hypothetical protein [Candidatus Omnitrophota bacterium]MCB9720175.1 hypothetical protein [Candidatus Omnitrophota bacterium]
MLRLFYRRQNKIYLDTEALLRMALDHQIASDELNFILDSHAGLRTDPLVEV